MRLLAFLSLSAILTAQDRRQFVWQGEVDGTAILYLQANRLKVRVQEGEPIARQQYHFYDRLPETQQNARLEVREGRGLVHIVDQPRLDNSYTLAVSIEDRQPGSSFYSLALYWDTSNNALERSAGKTGRIRWSGRVDEEALIRCLQQTCSSSAAHGAPAANEHFKFSRPLPQQSVDVRLEDQDGRGDIRLVEQPSERNNYSAVVSIRDPQSGSGEYSFSLVWMRPSTKEIPPTIDAARGLLWTGVVDGRARVTVHGSSSISEGAQTEHADFLRPLPAGSDIKPAVKKLNGRGQVQIVEYPSDKNNYTLVFEIVDSQAGPTAYTVEVDW